MRRPPPPGTANPDQADDRPDDDEPTGEEGVLPPFFGVNQSQNRLPTCTRRYDAGVA